MRASLDAPVCLGDVEVFVLLPFVFFFHVDHVRLWLLIQLHPVAAPEREQGRRGLQSSLASSGPSLSSEGMAIGFAAVNDTIMAE